MNNSFDFNYNQGRPLAISRQSHSISSDRNSKSTRDMDCLPPPNHLMQYQESKKRFHQSHVKHCYILSTNNSWGSSPITPTPSWQPADLWCLLQEMSTETAVHKPTGPTLNCLVLVTLWPPSLTYRLNQNLFVSLNGDAVTLCRQPGAPTQRGCGQLFSEL